MTTHIATGGWASRGCAALLVAGLLGGAACDRKAPAPVPADGQVQPEPPSLPKLRLHVGAFSALSEAIGVRVLPDFALHWMRTRRQDVEFVERYDGSGTLAGAVRQGFAADVVLLALTEDMHELQADGVVPATWRDAPHGGILCRSLIALAVRRGNPKGIRGWRDLVRDDVTIVCPDPATSGCGVWAVCAAYGAALRGHADVAAGDPVAARAFLARVWSNVVASGVSAREAFRTFQAGTGDVAIIYESEIAKGWLYGHTDERVVPASTLLVESPMAVVGGNADAHGVRAVAEGLLQFLRTPRIQRRLANCGLRPVEETVLAEVRAQFPQPDDLWTIDALGGWAAVARDVLAPAGFGAPAPSQRR